MRRSRQPLKSSPLARQVTIFRVTSQLIFALAWDRITGNSTSLQRARRALWLTNTLVELGPTFIKIGQALSTRGDILPLEYVQALGTLQDQVPDFNSEDAIAIVEKELGNPIHALFRDFEPLPLACASLGQVHRAQLHTGEEVVVKVQRPGLEEVLNLDFEVLHHVLRLANRWLPGLRKYELEEIYHEFFELLYQEIDYIHEGKNADRFRQNFCGHSRVIVPTVYWRYTTKKVLTLEYLPGIKIDDTKTLQDYGIVPNEVIQLGICSYLKQLLQDGFFQSDPHPGNMAVSQEGNLIFYDFGTMAEVKSIAKEQMVKTFFAVVRKDTDEVVNTLTYMGLIKPAPNMTPVKRLVAFLLEKFTDKPVDLQAFDQVRYEIYLMFKQQPFRLPAQMTFILKALTTLDGIARALNPQYNLMAASQPFIQSLTVSGGRGQMVRQLARQTGDFVRYKLQQTKPTELLIHRLEARIEEAELQMKMHSEANDRALKRLNLALKSLVYVCLTGFTLLGGTLLLNFHLGAAVFIFSISGVSFLILLRYLISLAIRERFDRLAHK